MRSMPIDTTALTFLVSGTPTPVTDFQTRQPKADANGEPLYSIQLVALQPAGADVIVVKVPGLPTVPQGQMARVVGLVAMPWENNGRSGIAFRAARIEAMAPAGKST